MELTWKYLNMEVHVKADHPFAAYGPTKDFARVDLARDVSQDPENKVFRFRTLFWAVLGCPFGSILAPSWDTLGALWHPMGPFGPLWGASGTLVGPFGSQVVPLTVLYELVGAFVDTCSYFF